MRSILGVYYDARLNSTRSPIRWEQNVYRKIESMGKLVNGISVGVWCFGYLKNHVERILKISLNWQKFRYYIQMFHPSL